MSTSTSQDTERLKEPEISQRERFIRMPEVESLTGMKRSSIYRMQSEKTFPRSVPLPGGRAAWIEELHDLAEKAELLKHSIMGVNSGLTTFEEGFAVFLTLLDNSAEEEMKLGRVHSALRPMFDHFQVAYRLHNAVSN